MMKSFGFVVLNVTEAVLLSALLVAGVGKFGSKGLLVSIPLIPNAVKTKYSRLLIVAVMVAADRGFGEIA